MKGWFIQRLKNYILDRLKEASTWKSIISFIATMIGYQLSGGQLELAGSAGAAVYAFLSAILPDKFGQPVTPIHQVISQSQQKPQEQEVIVEYTSPQEITPGPPTGSVGFGPNVR